MPEATPEKNVPTVRPPTKADHKRYGLLLKELHTDIEMIDAALRRVTRNMKAMHSGLYRCGGYTSFLEFCQKEFGKSRQQAYRLLQAHDTLQTLLEQGIAEADLPQNERLCREIRQIKDPAGMARIWKAVVRAKREEGKVVEASDVRKEAAKGDSASALDRQQTELIKKFEGINRSLKASFRFEVLTPHFRRRLLRALEDIIESVSLISSSLRSEAVTKRTADNQGPDSSEKGPELAT